MTPLVIAYPGNDSIASDLARLIEGRTASIELHDFPDGETRVTVGVPVAGQSVVVVCAFNQPNAKFLPLMLLGATLKDLGAISVMLVAPYLGYLRQDRRFHPGEGISSAYVSRWISGTFDALVTVDPHLHRYNSLGEIYTIPCRVVHAAGAIAAWIRTNVPAPVLVGPDSESNQWIAAVATLVGAPFVVESKDRRGDQDVVESAPNVGRWPDRTPVVLDDIISTGMTMLATVRHLSAEHAAAPVCIGVHAIFADGAHEALLRSGAAQVVTSNTIQHSSNAIDVARDLADAVVDLLGMTSGLAHDVRPAP